MPTKFKAYEQKKVPVDQNGIGLIGIKDAQHITLFSIGENGKCGSLLKNTNCHIRYYTIGDLIELGVLSVHTTLKKLASYTQCIENIGLSFLNDLRGEFLNFITSVLARVNKWHTQHQKPF